MSIKGTMRSRQLVVVQLMLCLLTASCRPVEGVAGQRHGAVAASNTAELAGSRGKSKPRTRPVNKSRCLDSAVAGGGVWTSFCMSIKDASF